MRTFAAALIALALTLAPAVTAQEEGGETIEIKHRVPSAGDTAGQMVKSTSKSSTSMTVDGEAMPTRDMTRTRTMRKKSEILAADAKAVTKVKVTFMEIATDVQMPEMPEGAGRGGRGRGRRRGGEGEEVADDDELVGNTYIVDISGGAPVVTDGEGAEVSTAIANAIARHEIDDGRYSGWGPALHEVIPAGSMKVGQRIDLDSKKMGIIFNAPRRRTVAGAPGEYSLTLSGTTKVLGVDCAVFDVRVKSSTTGDEPAPEGEGEGGRRRRRPRGPSETDMQGQLTVGIDNLWLYKLTIDGSTRSSMSMSRGERSMERSSDGTMKIEISSLYMSPKKAAQ